METPVKRICQNSFLSLCTSARFFSRNIVGKPFWIIIIYLFFDISREVGGLYTGLALSVQVICNSLDFQNRL